MPRLVLALAVVVLAAVPASADEPPRPPAYTTWVTPTGELIPRGKFFRSSSNALLYELGVGLSDRVDLRIQSLIIIIADLQLRVSVLPPESRMRLVVGGSAIGSFVNGGHAWLGGTLTAGYRGDRWGIHATARLGHHMGHTDDNLGLATAGVTAAVSSHTMVFVELIDAAWAFPGCATDDVAARERIAPPPDRCMRVRPARGVGLGMWWRDEDGTALGLSAIIADVDGEILPIGPLVSYSFVD